MVFDKNKINEIGLFRTALGIYLFYYQLILLNDFSNYFGLGSMVLPDLLTYKFSIFFWVWNAWILKSFFVVMMILTGIFVLGGLNRKGLALLFFLQISFHQANPLIIHEPQQLANLFLLMFFFMSPAHQPVFIKFSLLPQSAPDELIQAMRGVLAFPDAADEIGLKAKVVIEKNQGAKQKTIKAIRELIDNVSLR